MLLFHDDGTDWWLAHFGGSTTMPMVGLEWQQHARGIFLYLLDYELEMLQFALITREAEAGFWRKRDLACWVYMWKNFQIMAVLPSGTWGLVMVKWCDLWKKITIDFHRNECQHKVSRVPMRMEKTPNPRHSSMYAALRSRDPPLHISNIWLLFTSIHWFFFAERSGRAYRWR